MSDKVALFGNTVGTGTISNCIQDFVYSPTLVAVHGAEVTPHGDGEHASATMIATGHATVKVGDEHLRVVIDGDAATCGCTVTATGHAQT